MPSVTAKAKVAKGTKPKYCCELCDWKGQNLNRHYDKDHPAEVKSGAVKKRKRGAAGHAATMTCMVKVLTDREGERLSSRM